MKLLNAAKKFGAKVATGTALSLAVIGSAMATPPTAAESVVTAIEAAAADAKLVAVAVVLALWGIFAVYMLRRRG